MYSIYTNTNSTAVKTPINTSVTKNVQTISIKILCKELKILRKVTTETCCSAYKSIALTFICCYRSLTNLVKHWRNKMIANKPSSNETLNANKNLNNIKNLNRIKTFSTNKNITQQERSLSITNHLVKYLEDIAEALYCTTLSESKGVIDVVDITYKNTVETFNSTQEGVIVTNASITTNQIHLLIHRRKVDKLSPVVRLYIKDEKGFVDAVDNYLLLTDAEFSILLASIKRFI